MIKNLSTAFLIASLLHSCSVSEKDSKSKSSPYVTIVKTGITNNRINSAWLKALQKRESKSYLDSLVSITRPLSNEEQEWHKLLESITSDFTLIRDSLNAPFGKTDIADTIYVLLGYNGTDDAFTYEEHTLCLDLTALYANYGPAGKEVNRNRALRLMSHEYTHLLSKRWMKHNSWELPENHFASDSAFRKHILWEMWYEGLGVYRSLSSKWFPVGDSLSNAARQTLEKLSPVFVDKIITMDTTNALTPDQKKWIQHRVSDGPFTQKYGALPMAIWLALEAKEDKKNITKWINKGPEGILCLPKKYLTGEPKKRFDEVFKGRYDD